MLKPMPFSSWTLKIGGFAFLLLILSSCATKKFRSLEKQLSLAQTESQFSGFLLYNPATKDTLYAKNHNHYFTPASNTKIFTLFSALKTLSDSIPAFRYAIQGDSVYLQLSLIHISEPTRPY